MSFVLLQVKVPGAASTPAVEDSVIELSPAQLVGLGRPQCVRLEQITTAPGKKATPGMKILCEAREAADLSDDQCRLSPASLKVLGVHAGGCVRLQRLASFAVDDAARLAERAAEQQRREELVAGLQEALAKLAHERDWYMAQAERFRGELEEVAAALDLAHEERKVAVSMYAKSRVVEQELLNLKLKEVAMGGAAAAAQGAASPTSE